MVDGQTRCCFAPICVAASAWSASTRSSDGIHNWTVDPRPVLVRRHRTSTCWRQRRTHRDRGDGIRRGRGHPDQRRRGHLCDDVQRLSRAGEEPGPGGARYDRGLHAPYRHRPLLGQDMRNVVTFSPKDSADATSPSSPQRHDRRRHRGRVHRRSASVTQTTCGPARGISMTSRL